MPWQLALPVTVWFAGQPTVGGVTSRMDTEKAQVALLFAASVAVRVTVVVPAMGVPEAGLCVTLMLPGAVQLSDFVAKAK